MDSLIDMFNNLEVERTALEELRGELKLAVYTGTLGAAVRTSRKAIPNVGLASNETMVPGLVDVSKRVWKLNQDLLDAPPQVGPDSSTSTATVRSFKNF